MKHKLLLLGITRITELLDTLVTRGQAPDMGDGRYTIT